MRERLEKQIESKAKFVHISTIHSLCANILRRNATYLDYGRNFEVIDEEDQVKILNEIYKNQKLIGVFYHLKWQLRLLVILKTNHV